MRWATVAAVTDAGVYVTSSWLVGRTGPLPFVGVCAEGDAVLVARTDDGGLAVIGGSA